MPTYSPVNSSEVSFVQSTITNTEILGTATTFDVQLSRNTSSEAATVAVKSTFTSGVVCPASVTFNAGESTATLTLDVSGMQVGTRYTGTIELADSASFNANIAVATTKVTLQKVYTWVSLGKGEWFDNLLLYSGASLGIQEVEVLKAEGFDRYRIMAPYANTDQLAAGISAHFGTSATLAGPSNNKDNYIEFWVLENGENVAWDGWWYPGVLYQGIDMKGYYPSYLTGSTAEDALSGFYDELVVGFYPYWYMDDLGGFGAKYPCFLSLPGGPALESWL